MKYSALFNILLVVAVCMLIIALSLTGGSVSTSVKWNVYNQTKVYKYGNTFFFDHFDAYQTLWTSKDVNHNVYRKEGKKNDEVWRSLVRLLLMSLAGPGTLSFVILIVFSCIPSLKQKTKLLIMSRIVSSILSATAGGILGYALNIYKNKYSSLLLQVFYDAHYPGKDSVSTGFYMASAASGLFFISAVINVVSIVSLIKTQPSTSRQHKIGPAPADHEQT